VIVTPRLADSSAIAVNQDSRVQQLRGIAIVLVVAYHAGGLLPAGFIGVDVFFVISGYVITLSVTDRMRTGTFDLLEFLRRRVRRIVPALSLMLVTTLLLANWFSTMSSRTETLRTGLFASLGFANAFLYRFRPDGYFEDSAKSNALLHAWSLSLEEQFYLVFALVLALGIKVGALGHSNRRSVATLFVMVTAAISFTACIWMTHISVEIGSPEIQRLVAADSLDSRFSFYMPMTRAWEFLIGVLVALVKPSTRSWSGGRVLQVAGLMMVGSSAVLMPIDLFPGVWTLFPVVGTAAMLFSDSETSLTKSRLAAPLSYLGDRSYGWYLWHWPLMQFVSPFSATKVVLLLAGLVALLPASLSLKFIENPVRTRIGWKAPRRTAAVLVVSIAVPVATFSLTRNPQPDLGHHLDVRLGCAYGDISKLSRGQDCVIETSGALGVAALVGDSHASHLSEAFVSASRDLRLDAMLASRANSPFLFLEKVADAGNSREQRQMVEHLIQTGVTLVVLAQSDYSIPYLKDSGWDDGMRPVLTALTQAGIRVVLVSQSVFVEVNPLACSTLQVRVGACDAEIAPDTTRLNLNRKRVVLEQRLDAEFPAVRTYDALPYLCPEESCPLRREGKWWWRDGGHISVHASEQLTASLRDAMASALSN